MISNTRKRACSHDGQFSLYESYTKKYGLNSESLLVFMWIYHNPHGITQESTAKQTLSTKQVIQATVRTYMKKGILYLESSRIDRRKKLIRLTETGQQFAVELLEPLADSKTQAMSILTLEEQEVLLSATAMLTDRLEELLGSHRVKKHVK